MAILKHLKKQQVESALKFIKIGNGFQCVVLRKVEINGVNGFWESEISAFHW